MSAKTAGGILEETPVNFLLIAGGISEEMLGKYSADTSGGNLRKVSHTISEGMSTQKKQFLEENLQK